jgi:signal transduction histidine kinase
MIDVAIESATRIARLVDDLLSLGQSEHEGARLWDLHEGIEAAMRILQRRAAKVEMRTQFDFHGKIRCRPDALNQVFLNLIDNALHAVEDGGVVEVRTREEDGGVVVLVADSGKGVPRDVQSRIFEPFFSTRAPGNGTGLGLHISQRVALDHGGRLELVDAEGWGACFRLWLPGASP